MELTFESRWFAIVNPVAGSGKGLTDWPLISKLFRDYHIVSDFAFTEYKHHATELAFEAIAKGYRKVIVVGGDGTIHEVVNGILLQQHTDPREILVAVIAVGTGNDWIRMFGIPRKYSEAIKAISEGHSFLQDVGNFSYHKAYFKQNRYMANVAGIGFDAFVNRKYTKLKEQGKSGKWLYIWATFKAVMRYNSTGVKIWIDDELVVNDLIYSGTIGIGKYNGGGMLQMPDAVADDGLFDVTVIRRINRIGVLLRFKALYNGKIYNLKHVSKFKGRNIRIESSPEIAAEVDGEPLGYTPFEFSMLNRAIRVIVAERFLRELK